MWAQIATPPHVQGRCVCHECGIGPDYEEEIPAFRITGVTDQNL